METERKKPSKWLIAVLAIASAVIAASVVTLIRSGDGSAAAPARDETPDLSANPVDPDRTDPNPSGPEWTTAEFQSLALPVSKTGGPFDLSDGRARGFAHTELGAVAAAIHLPARVSGPAGPNIFEPSIAEQTTGPYKTDLAITQARIYESERLQYGVPYGDPTPMSATVEAYKIDRYRPAAAKITLLMRGQGVVISSPVSLAWEGDEWKLIAPAAGSFSEGTENPDPSAFVMFEKVN